MRDQTQEQDQMREWTGESMRTETRHTMRARTARKACPTDLVISGPLTQRSPFASRLGERSEKRRERLKESAPSGLTGQAAEISYGRYGLIHSDPALALARGTARGGGTCRDSLNSSKGADRLCTSTWSAPPSPSP